jgi:plasmid stabilization system protein ParE
VTRRALVFHPGVEDDLASILDYYETFDPALPSRFEARLDEQIERIELFPESGAILF